jgi:hypothetical protein
MLEPTEQEELEQYHHLADIAIRTLATILAIIFAYVFSGEVESIGKLFVLTVTFTIIIGIIFSVVALYGKISAVGIVKWCAIIATVIMTLVICMMFIFLSWILLF